ncbi:MAG: hypothetical protein GXO10_02130 [Crenarchaeota archaeon]|nr:hypothetical protein [Thermoproteota archaeon]
MSVVEKNHLLILGIDCAEHSMLRTFWSELTNFNSTFREVHTYHTTVPPITIPAWLTIFSGFNPGWFGLYDVKVREPGTYTSFKLFNRKMIERFRFIWDYVSSKNGRVVLCYVPGTYPPPKVNGVVVSDFFCPSVNDPNFTYPPDVKSTVLSAINGEEYIIDVPGYKRMDPRKLFNLLLRKIDQDMKIFMKIIKNFEWNLAICVLMSIDRANHTLWKYFDKEHPRYVHDPELEDGLLKLYKRIDYWFGEILKIVPRDCKFVLLSDHGAKRMYLRVNINEILAQEGFLKLREKPSRPMSLQEADQKGLIDWERTVAWSWGAYVGQVWINLKDREPRGTVPREEYYETCKQVADALSKITDPDGRRIEVKVYFKWDIYRGPRTQYMPDITIYFNNLHYGANWEIGHESVYSYETQVGADDSNHGELAVFTCSENVKPPENAEEVVRILRRLLEEY